MIFYIDYEKKCCYIVSPKCGNTTISKYLNLNIHIKYSNEEIYNILKNNDFLKIIVVRDVLERFLSGFYEDLNNNSCYLNIDISFYKYCIFLKYCHDNKIKNVNNLNLYFKKYDVPIWWGNCSNKFLNITDENGNISGHLVSQKLSINNLVSLIKGNNVKVINTEDLFLYLPQNKEITIQNKKKYSNELNINYKVKLSDLKKNINFRVSTKQLYNIKIIKIINSIYKEDIDYIEYLKNTFNH